MIRQEMKKNTLSGNTFTARAVAVLTAFAMAAVLLAGVFPMIARGETALKYDSRDTAVIVKADNKNVTLRNLDRNKNYTLAITATSRITGPYGKMMTGEMLTRGTIAEVTFMRDLKTLSTLSLYKEAFSYTGVTDFDLGESKGSARIGGATLELPSDTPVITDDGITDIYSVGKWDTISVYGLGHTIESISIDRGHGFISLKNDEDVLGGWIEVGNTVITEISEGMVLTVPEGDYEVVFDSSKLLAKKEVTVESGKETVIDLKEATVEILRQGKVFFDLTPPEARVFVDGQEAGNAQEVVLDYGAHRVDMEAEGYLPLTKYINIGSETARFKFSLEKKPSDTQETKETEAETESSEETEDDWRKVQQKDKDQSQLDSLSGNTLKGSTSLMSGKPTDNTVYIKAPSGATLTLDGKEMGVVPISFPKIVGTHVLTFSKDGAVTHGYTVYFYDDGEDLTYSFPEL